MDMDSEQFKIELHQELVRAIREKMAEPRPIGHKLETNDEITYFVLQAHMRFEHLGHQVVNDVINERMNRHRNGIVPFVYVNERQLKEDHVHEAPEQVH